MKKSNMMCDLETGVCGESTEDTMDLIDFNPPQKKINLYYVTDPICSHCWALEPALRRFEQQYGHYFTMHTVMGGLLKSWDGFADVKNGIGRPADVADHWKEVGEHSRMPIDGSLWLNNPIQSSYPAARVFKIIQQSDEQLANVYLRRAREAVFAFNQNIGEKEILIDIVNQIGLDGETIVKEAETTTGQQLLDQDFALARSLGVRGFPTIIIVNEESKGVKIVGARPVDYYVKGLMQALATDQLQPEPLPVLSRLLEKEARLFSKELEIMYDLEPSAVRSFIEKELCSDEYQLKEILGEIYVEK
ncbi:DsbA family oxidoreductase [Bacillus sp. FJAT-42315]|uniref:DsbA family oxidoreductase n=1 Tax=Bacillus sp. FJAT-42315 TaxID=2014077 RepID=UPI000C24AF63|nr:DsbA family protein [Bacillus sp. FJAT-42315]